MIELRIGRYRIAFGRYGWFPARGPTRIWHFLCFWLFKGARHTDIDKRQQFPLGTPLEHEGRVYRYWRAPCDLPKGSCVTEDGLVKDGEVRYRWPSDRIIKEGTDG